MTPTSVEQTEQQTRLTASPATESASVSDVLCFRLLFLFRLVPDCETCSLLILQLTTKTARYCVRYFSCLQNSQVSRIHLDKGISLGKGEKGQQEHQKRFKRIKMNITFTKNKGHQKNTVLCCTLKALIQTKTLVHKSEPTHWPWTN